MCVVPGMQGIYQQIKMEKREMVTLLLSGSGVAMILLCGIFFTWWIVGLQLSSEALKVTYRFGFCRITGDVL